MALEIEIPLNGKNYLVTYNGLYYNIREENTKKPLQLYPTSMSRVLYLLVKESLANSNSEEVINLQEYINKLEELHEQLRGLGSDIVLEVTERTSTVRKETIKSPKKKEPEPVVERPNPFGSF